MQHVPSSQPLIGEPAFSPASLLALQTLALDTSEDVVGKILGLFKVQLDKSVAEIDQALAHADWRALKVSSHALKGACVNVGANRLAECCRQMETVAALAMQQHLEQRHSEFCTELQRVQQELRLLLTEE